MRILPSLLMGLMLLAGAPEARASISGGNQLVLDFTKPAEVKTKAQWSPADKLDFTKAGLGWDGEANSYRDVWIQTTEPLAIGEAWRPASSASIRAEVTPPMRHVDPAISPKLDMLNRQLFVRYSPDAKHWSTWQPLAEQAPTEKNPGAQVFEGRIEIPQRDREAYWELLRQYQQMDVPWKSDEEAAVRWILTKDPNYFEKNMPFVGYIQFLFEAGFYGGMRMEKLTFSVGWGLSGMHQPPKDPKAYKEQSGPWKFKADEGPKPAAKADIEAPETAWSESVDGLRVRLVTDRDVYEEGQYVWLHLDVLNTTDKPVGLAWGKSLEDHFTLTRADEAIKPQKKPLDQLGVCTLSPHKQTDLMLFYVSGNQYASYGPLKPGKYEARWTSAPGEIAPNGARLAPSVKAAFEVIAAKPVAPPTANPPDVPWGEAKGGLRARLRAPALKFPAGAPIPIVVEVKNVGDKVVHYHVPQVAQNGRIEVRDGAGQPVPYIAGGAQTVNPQCALEPNEVATLESADLSVYYFLRKPGKYSARWPGAKAWPDSGPPFEGVPADPSDSDLPATNTFEFEVAPSDFHDPFEEAIGVILRNRPAEWSVSFHPSVSRLYSPGSQWSRVPGRGCRLEHKDMYRDGRLDQLQIHPIRLWLASEKAVEEPWEKVGEHAGAKTECLGRGRFGWLYIEPANETSLKHWPAVKADLVKWLEIRKDE